ncbi:MAG: 50S ribosomal protein L25 [Deltaproteobacteria bacterium]|nr:50S ribosomal protein L25 [Deltaproteobacteria bacterium]MBW2595859.1 50S ribosomal protein L25 [Deltaproteobacteria bacterium]MBW2650220.1 50S ribosomal protein L25 [Deltaproteobacteria bacterium]
MKTIELSAQMREEIGKGPSRRLRSEGFVPAIFYGYETEPMVIKVDSSELVRALGRKRGESVFVKLGIGSGKKGKVEKLSVIKDLQIDTINRKPVHVDFYEIKMDRTLVVDVPIIFSGTPVGLENGGELQQLKRELKVSGLPSDLPDSVEIDIGHLNIGDSVRVEDIAIKDGVQFIDQVDVAVASVVPTRVSLATEEPGEEEGEVAEEAASTPEGEEEQAE